MSAIAALRRLVAPVSALLALGLLAAGLAGCSAQPIEVSADTTIIDVRTQAEYDEGHLAGAIDLDVTDPRFTQLIADLPKEQEYVVYCRSGNRSAQAVKLMEQAGFSHVTDAGGINDAAGATGLEIVK
jgi:rhodanese-related sulfurtransferase